MEDKDLILEGTIGNFFKKLFGLGSDELSLDNFYNELPNLPDNQVKGIRDALAGIMKDKKKKKMADDALIKLTQEPNRNDKSYDSIGKIYDKLSPEELKSLLKNMTLYSDRVLKNISSNKPKSSYRPAYYVPKQQTQPETEPVKEPETSKRSDNTDSGNKEDGDTNKKYTKKYIDKDKLENFTVKFDLIRPRLKTLKNYIDNINKIKKNINNDILDKDFSKAADVLSSMEVGDKIGLNPIEGQTDFIKPGDYMIAMKDDTGRPVIRFGSKESGVIPVDILKENKLKYIVKYFLNK